MKGFLFDQNLPSRLRSVPPCRLSPRRPSAPIRRTPSFGATHGRSGSPSCPRTPTSPTASSSALPLLGWSICASAICAGAHHGLATGPCAQRTEDRGPTAGETILRQTRLRFPQAQGRGICGRLLLARLPPTRHPAQDQRRLLARQDRHEQGEGPPRQSRLARLRLVGGSGLGTRVAPPR